MNINTLIDAIVRHTTVLIAQLATSAGARAPLAHVANRVFLDLVAELESQGVRQKVIADMFGLALRSYQRRVQRLSESETEAGRTLWEAIFDYLHEHELVTKVEVLRRFRYDDESMVRGVLRDLVDSGLVFQAGGGDRAAFRIATDDELGRLRQKDEPEGTRAIVWVTVYRNQPLSIEELEDLVRMDRAEFSDALDELVRLGNVTRDPLDPEILHSSKWVLPRGSQYGWEAAMLDHFQAVVQTLARRLRELDSDDPPTSGGSTYAIDIWDGHPHARRVRGLLDEVRNLVAEVQADVRAHNAKIKTPDAFDRITFYAGQSEVASESHQAEETS